VKIEITEIADGEKSSYPGQEKTQTVARKKLLLKER
jgi:hypothetical protein